MAPSLLRAASHLTTPLSYASSMTLRIISPMNRLGKYDFCTTKATEVTLRTFYLLSLLPLLTFGLLLLLPSILVRRIGLAIQKSCYSYAKGNAPEKKFMKSATFLTWNVCGMPAGLSRPFGGMVEWSKRVDGIANCILSSEADVVCLQEVLDTALGERLKEKLKHTYKHLYYHIGHSSFRLGSGLFVASKFRIHNFSFTPFTTHSKHYRMHYKGFVSGSLLREGQPPLQFLATHACAGPAHISGDVRKKQLIQMLEQAKNQPTVCLGDFNCELFSEEWKNSPLSTLQRDDTFQAVTAADTHKYIMFDNHRFKAPEERLDDILTNFSTRISTKLLDATEGLSDHQPVIAQLTLSH